MSDLPDDTAARLAALETALGELQAVRAVEDTLHRYAHAIDHGHHDDWVDCFTSDGVLELRRTDGIVRAEGHDQLAAYVGRHSHAPDAWHQHLVRNPVVQVHGDTASCLSYAGLLGAHAGALTMQAFGRYDDLLRRCADRRWRLAVRRATIDAWRDDLSSPVRRG